MPKTSLFLLTLLVCFRIPAAIAQETSAEPQDSIAPAQASQDNAADGANLVTDEAFTCPEGTTVIKVSTPDGSELGCQKPGPDDQPVLQGPWQSWHANGVLSAMGAYENGERHGTWIRWHDNAQPASQGDYDHGLQDGEWKVWSPDYVLLVQGSYSRGKKMGTWTRWHDDGSIAETGSYVNGRRDGTWTRYHPGGAKQEEGRYVNGYKEGTWITWNEDGTKHEEGEYRHGEKTGQWNTWYGGGPTEEEPAQEPQDLGQESQQENTMLVPAVPVSSLESGSWKDQAPEKLSLDDLQVAEEMDTLDMKGLRMLRPKAARLPPNPQVTTDFTAYTLEPGAVKVGLLSMGVGLLPNTQISTMPMLYYASIPNGNLKVDAVRFGPLDIAISGSRYWLHQDTFRSSLTTVATVASLTISDHWGLHMGLSYSGIAARGSLDTCNISALLTSAECDESSTDDSSTNSDSGSPLGLEGNDVYGELMGVRLATDIRLNRRDSIILQASAIPYAALQVADDVELPDIAELDEALSFDGWVPISETYTASIAFQMAWKNVHFRVGVGYPFNRYLWLTQTMELSVRFGGKSRRERSRQQKAWRKNRRDIREGFPAGDESDESGDDPQQEQEQEQ